MRPGLLADAAGGAGRRGLEGLRAPDHRAGARGRARTWRTPPRRSTSSPPGQVPDVSAAILDDVGSDDLVALGGGRVIDAAKAVAAVRGGRVAAIPTTLSGAEMTAIHRLPAGHEGAQRRPARASSSPTPT